MRIALYEPRIPQNTGNIGRTCVAYNLQLDLIRPLGFSLDNKYLKRAGLDYWDYIDWEYFPDLKSYCKNMVKNENYHLLTTKSSKPYTSQQFQRGDYLVFGSETSVIDESFLKQHWSIACTIPMENKNIRSLNLATSVGIVLYEAIRQINAS